MGFRFRRRVKIFPGVWLNLRKAPLHESVASDLPSTGLGFPAWVLLVLIAAGLMLVFWH